jgi:hypothetical protein
MTRQMPAIDELNGMSGLGLLRTLAGLPKSERNAILDQMHDDAVRRYVRAAWEAKSRRVGLIVCGLLIAALLSAIG